MSESVVNEFIVPLEPLSGHEVNVRLCALARRFDFLYFTVQAGLWLQENLSYHAGNQTKKLTLCVTSLLIIK